MTPISAEIFEQALSSPIVSEQLIAWMIAKGTEIKPHPVTHDERVIVIRKVMADLAKREAL